MPDEKRDDYPRGTRGSDGPQGNQGNQGSQGDRGDPGAIGPAGFKGQTGEHGLQGVRGETGPAGASTTGATGATGRTGKAGGDPTKRLLVMFIFVTLIFTVLAWRTQHNGDKIVDNQREARVEACESGAVVLQRFNNFLESMARVEQRGINTGDLPAATETRKDRIRIYRAGLVPIPNCKKLNPSP
jgi:hypothetical protein